MAENTSQRHLARKVAEIMAAVSHVPKAGHNDHFNYSFAQESDVLAAVRGEMAKRQLALFPSVVAHQVREVAGKNGVLYVTTIRVEFTLEDGESGETRSFCIMGEGQDNTDKGSNKALTAAEKYAALKLFMIPTGADPDADAPQEEVPRTQATPRPAALRDPAPAGGSRPAPAPQRRAPTSSTGPDTFPGFGSQKGKPLAGAAEKDLKWYAKVLRENVADPAKARFKSENAAYLAAIELALDAGLETAGNYNDPPPPGDDDAPF